MLQLQVLRQDPKAVKEKLAIKHFADTGLVDEIIALDDERKRLQLESDTTQSKINAASKEIGQLMAKGEKDAAEAKKQEVAALKTALQPIADKLAATEKTQNEKLVLLPNLPSSKVPAGKTPADNIMVKESGTKPTLPAGSVPHWDLIKKYDIVDFETGAKITGSGFPLYKGKGAKLQRALIQYFLDYNTAAGYTEYLPPFMVNEATAYGTGQLPDKEGQMYHMQADNFYMIPTSEVPVTNIYRDEIVKEDSLPIKMTAYSPCFRREAGSFGKDVRGLNRVHQFEKVEIVQLVHPEKSYDVLDEMVSHVEKLLNTLELPFRILRLCGGDMSFASALTYDFEVYSAAQEKWLEVSSVSNFETFQTNRMKIRFKDANGKSQLVHSLNGSSLALPRIVACLLENNQTADGIKLPAVLHSYFGAGSISLPSLNYELY
ncbi:MAG: serine--tRNA ligase [Chitinophagaceae bacterium]|nr:serine--tRNA ligase [Chitinophagaceae bacterium]